MSNIEYGSRETHENACSAYNHLHERQRAAAMHGLYSPEMERDACGVGFVANIDGKASNKVSCDEISNVMHLL